MRCAREMVADGVDIVDVGGQSTRPGAPEGSEAEELARVLPVIRWGLRVAVVRYEQATLQCNALHTAGTGQQDVKAI